MAPADETLDEIPRRRVLYGRRKGRRLRPGQSRLVAEYLPKFEILDLPESVFLSPRDLFPSEIDETWLEIGFGAGEHMLAQAEANERVGFIGCEPFFNGVVQLISGMHDRGVENIRIYRDDARLLLARLPNASVARAFVLFPDPWPKTRHHKRRIVSKPVLDQLHRILKPDAELRIATDDPGYLDWILQHVIGHGGFDWLARRPADWREKPDDWPDSRYETKARLAGRSCAYLRLVSRTKSIDR
ncbi:MAG: tRNA (guanosine(46)-N7)-methyltransferase TrmB [Rhodospirillales bacterium]|nr:tRNA (guanosine(46)-N7)-methyltransferase TrmB [Rhodospirillales bacterium]